MNSRKASIIDKCNVLMPVFFNDSLSKNSRFYVLDDKHETLNNEVQLSAKNISAFEKEATEFFIASENFTEESRVNCLKGFCSYFKDEYNNIFPIGNILNIITNNKLINHFRTFVTFISKINKVVHITGITLVYDPYTHYGLWADEEVEYLIFCTLFHMYDIVKNGDKSFTKFIQVMTKEKPKIVKIIRKNTNIFFRLLVPYSELELFIFLTKEFGITYKNIESKDANEFFNNILLTENYSILEWFLFEFNILASSDDIHIISINAIYVMIKSQKIYDLLMNTFENIAYDLIAYRKSCLYKVPSMKYLKRLIDKFGLKDKQIFNASYVLSIAAGCSTVQSFEILISYFKSTVLTEKQKYGILRQAYENNQIENFKVFSTRRNVDLKEFYKNNTSITAQQKEINDWINNH